MRIYFYLESHSHSDRQRDWHGSTQGGTTRRRRGATKIGNAWMGLEIFIFLVIFL